MPRGCVGLRKNDMALSIWMWSGIPMLILDGDALDRRNNHDGQVKTRFEAFLELIGQEDRS